jgi:hypothetical protein
MPELIEHIDAIARRVKRDVLFLVFVEPGTQDLSDAMTESFFQTNRGNSNIENETRLWLTKNNIGHYACAPFASENFFMGGPVWLYIDVPFEENNVEYKLISNYLENKDGTMKIPGVRFCYTTLEKAMKNAHHDEPGYWDKFDY